MTHMDDNFKSAIKDLRKVEAERDAYRAALEALVAAANPFVDNSENPAHVSEDSGIIVATLSISADALLDMGLVVDAARDVLKGDK